MTGEGLRLLLARATALAVEYWEQLPGRRAFTRPPDDVREAVRNEALPAQGVAPDDTFAVMARRVMPFPFGGGHPRWWAFIATSAHPMGIAADVVAGVLNNACFAGPQIATDYEHLVLRWLGELCRYPEPGGGVLVSGGSMANAVALAAARDAMAARGLNRRSGPVAVYCSANAHFSVARALRLLGFDASEQRSVPDDPDGRFDVAALRGALAADREAGVRPLAIVATAGSAGTGAIDRIADLADVAEEAGCWLHVDAAYGGPAASLPEMEGRFAGVERADSLSVDPHKWLYTPYEVGAVLVRRREDLAAAFASDAPYTEITADAYFGDTTRFQDVGPQQTRAFRALKVWATIRSIGLETYRDLWRNDIAVAREVCRLAREHPRLEVLSEGDLSIFVVRYLPEAGEVNAFNRRLLDAVHRDGRMFLGPMTLDGRVGLRGCVVNFRSRLDDARTCVDVLAELGRRLEEGNA